nr:glucan biosynthesis protein [Marinobacter similis]
MDRRLLLQLFAAGVGIQALPAGFLYAAGKEGNAGYGESKPFSYEWLKGHARHLAAQDFRSKKGELPQSLKDLSWDDYQAIRFRPEHALWSDAALPYQIQLFHLGLYFQTPVKIHEVVDGQATELAYDPEYFEYEGEQPLGELPSNLLCRFSTASPQ